MTRCIYTRYAHQACMCVCVCVHATEIGGLQECAGYSAVAKGVFHSFASPQQNRGGICCSFDGARDDRHVPWGRHRTLLSRRQYKRGEPTRCIHQLHFVHPAGKVCVIYIIGIVIFSATPYIYIPRIGVFVCFCFITKKSSKEYNYSFYVITR